METMTAPRKKTGAKKTGPTKKAGRPKGEQPPRRTIASFKASQPFEEWFDALVRYLRIPASSAIEKGLILLAEREKFADPPPER